MRPSTRQFAPGARRRRGAAVFAALLLAGALGVAGCSASSNGSASNADKAAAPALGDARSAPGNGAESRSDAGGGAVADGTGGSSSGSASSAPSTGTGSGKAPNPAPTYLVRTAQVGIRTPHVADALQQARTLVAGMGGYAGDEDTSVDATGHAASTVQLRVPPAAYDTLLDDLGKLGTLVERKVSVEDVTGQVVDVQSRIKSQQASVDRVRKLMNQASGLSDVVSLESELSTRESALEALEAQQASLRAQTDLATVTLRLSEPPVKAVAHKAPAKKKDGFGKTVGNALGGGWHAFYVTVRALLVALSAVLPFLALAVLVWVAVRLVRRWWPRSEPQAPPAPRPAGWLPKHLPAQGQRSDPHQQDPVTAPHGAPQQTVAPAAPPVPPQAAPPSVEEQEPPA